MIERFDAAVVRHAVTAAVLHRILVIGAHGQAPTGVDGRPLPPRDGPGPDLCFPGIVEIDLSASTVTCLTRDLSRLRRFLRFCRLSRLPPLSCCFMSLSVLDLVKARRAVVVERCKVDF